MNPEDNAGETGSDIVIEDEIIIGGEIDYKNLVKEKVVSTVVGVVTTVVATYVCGVVVGWFEARGKLASVTDITDVTSKEADAEPEKKGKEPKKDA